jgi:uronate dehydrogenase
VRLTWNVLEAAVAGRVRRVVLASSNHVVGGYEHDQPYRSIITGERDGLDPRSVPVLSADVPVRPDGAYAAGKVMDEAAARFFADDRGLSVLALRIGTVRPGDRPESARHLATLLTHRDLVHLVECCIDAPDDLRFGAFYGVSANTWRIWDIETARVALGYAPRDDAEAWRSTLDGS